MQRIPDEFVEDLRRRVDIVDVISEHVQLRRAGRSYVGLCPFHNERSPSFSVSSDRQMFHCFGCGAGGTVFRFVMDIESLSFGETVVKLAHRISFSLPFEPELTQAESDQPSRQQRARDAHELATKLYSYILMNTAAGVQALAYIDGRGLSRQTAVDFRLGYAPASGDTLVALLRRRGFEDDILLESGLAVSMGKQVVDRFRDRLMIPIADAQARVIAFGGRSLAPEGKPKYLNSPETSLFHKGTMLFNQHMARKDIRSTRSVVLLEGYMDVMTAWQAGVKNALASLGTAFTPEQAGLIKRMAERVIIAYDGDSAGLHAAVRALDVVEPLQLDVRVAVIPGGLDPDDFVRAHGVQAFQSILKVESLSPVQFRLRHLRNAADLQSAAGRNQFLRQALELLSRQASPLEQEVEMKSLSQEFHVSMETMKEELTLVAKQSRRKNTANARPDVGTPAAPQALLKGSVAAGNRILQAMMLDAHSFQFVMDRGVDSLILPEQTALLALLYGFRLTQPEADISAFVDQLDDAMLLRLATSLLVADPPLLGEGVLEDYLRAVTLHRLEDEYKATLAELMQSQLRGDREQVAERKTRVDELQRQISQLKTSHAQIGSYAGVKEAGK